MPHDATKVLLGTTQTSYKVVDNHAGSIAAGKLVRKKSDDSIVVTAADGQAIGVSLGASLSDIARTAVVRKGTRVPVLLTAGLTPVIGAQVHFSDTTGLAAAAGAGATGVNATYATGALTGIDESGNSVAVALIDFPGGL